MSQGIISKISKYRPFNIFGTIREMGVIGAIKTLYYSLRYCGRPAAILARSKSSININKNSSVDIEDTFRLGLNHSPIIHPVLGGTRLDVETNATFKITGDYPWVGPGTVLQIHGYFEMGDSFINGLSRVFCNNKIKIGDNCVISWNVDILDYNAHELYIDGERSHPGPVVIGDNVWVGQGVTILPNVEIEDNAVIGAESVVTKDVPSGSLAVGNPAEIIETNIRWE